MSFTKINYIDNETIITAENLNAIQDAILNIDNIYPVGSIYMSMNNISPASFLGGVWGQINNHFLIGAGDAYVVGSTGGSVSHIHTTGDHTLTINEIPSHLHYNGYPVVAPSANGYGINGYAWIQNSSDWGTLPTQSNGGGAAHNHGNTGYSSNLPPYLAVYMWTRVA